MTASAPAVAPSRELILEKWKLKSPVLINDALWIGFSDDNGGIEISGPVASGTEDALKKFGLTDQGMSLVNSMRQRLREKNGGVCLVFYNGVTSNSQDWKYVMVSRTN